MKNFTIPPLYENLNEIQTDVLKFTPIPFALLSVFGSCLILFHVVVGKRLKKSYHRIMMGLSICDICVSLPLAFIPPLAYPILDPESTMCKIDGFVYVFSYTSFLYAASLSTYYILIVKYGVSDERLSKYYEPFFHIISIVWPLVCAIYGAVTSSWNLTRVKFGCTVFGEQQNQPLYFLSSIVPLLLSLALLVSNNVRVYYHVKRYEKKNNNQDRFTAFSRPSVTTVQSSSTIGGSERDPSSSKHWDLSCFGCGKENATSGAEPSKAARVGGQALLYLCAFFGAISGTLVVVIVTAADRERASLGKYFSLLVFEAATTPLQGFFNCFVFLRPRYLRWRYYNSTQSRWFSLYKAAFCLQDPRNASRDEAAVWGEQPSIEFARARNRMLGAVAETA